MVGEGRGRRRLRVGVLAMQGAVREHLDALRRCGCEAVTVKRVEQLKDLHGLIIPGGESTTIGELMREYGFFPAIKQAAENGLGIYGTCAGMILLAKEIRDSDQPRLGIMDVVVRRNAFGRQRESFEIDLDIPLLGEHPFRAVFIRAPYIESAGPAVEVLASLGGKIVLAREGRLLASAFHPELTDDLRIHQYFVQMLSAQDTGAIAKRGTPSRSESEHEEERPEVGTA